jgi:predicted HTH transcriptional regulator
MDKTFHENITRFFLNPTRETFRQLFVENYGEQNNLEFKSEWPQHFSKVAKHIFAMANSGGGVIIFGVSESDDGLVVTAGLDKIIDKADISNGLASYLNSEIIYNVLDFPYETSDYGPLEGKKFQVLIVEYDDKHLPYVTKRGGEELRQNAIYVRRGTSSVEATYEELQNLVNTRISTQYSTSSELKLEEHLAQLKLLYSQITKYHYVYGESFFNIGEMVANAFKGQREQVINANFPAEDFDKFIARMIEFKKNRIERLIAK